MDSTQQVQGFQRHLAGTSPFPMGITVTHSEGVYIYGPDGRRWLDLISGIGVSALGHQHLAVTTAVKNQVDRYMHVMVYGEFIQSPQVEMAERLVATLPETLDNAFLVNSGSEAIEGAMKLAKRHTGRAHFVSFHKAYHGATHGALSLSADLPSRQPFMPLLPGIRHACFGSLTAFDSIDETTAAVVVETIQGEAGVRLASEEWWKALRGRCDDTGTLLICDEIQCGMGRTGDFWAFEAYGIVPDIVVCAKGLGGGTPIGAFVAAKEMMQVLTNNPILGHITTFGGHPVSAAASAATLKVLQEDETILASVKYKAELFRKLLRHQAIKEIRGRGLLMAIQLDNFENMEKVIKAAIDKGLIIDWFLYCDDAIRIAPPLIATEKEIKEGAMILLDALDEVYGIID